MKDGNIYGHKRDIQYTRCFTCHGDLQEYPKTYTLQDGDELLQRLAFLNPVIDLRAGGTILFTDKGEGLWNIRQVSEGTYELFGKANGQRFTFRSVKGSACEQKLDQQESRYCHECHAVPR